MPATSTIPTTDDLKFLWHTRPRRVAHTRGAGVCAGIARHFMVDPLVVRVAVVVATLFGGAGAIAYLLAWWALPGPDGAPTTLHRSSGTPQRHGPLLPIVLVGLAVVASGAGIGTTFGIGPILGLLALAAGYWGLHLRASAPGFREQILTHTPTAASSVGTYPPAASAAPTPNAAPATAAPPTPDTRVPLSRYDEPDTAVDLTKAAAAAVRAPAASPSAAATTGTGDSPAPTGSSAAETPAASDTGSSAWWQRDKPLTPPAWDPLGAAPFAWDLPEPSNPQPEPPRRGPRIGLISLGLAVIAAASAGGLRAAGADFFTPGRIIALALVIIATGLVVGAVTGWRAHGLVPLTIVLAVATIAATAIGAAHLDFSNRQSGDRNWRPTTTDGIASDYRIGAGDGTLDLRNVTLTADRHVTLDVIAGNITVLLSPTMNVDVHCSTVVGSTSCPEGLDGGIDGTDGPVLRIDGKSTVGNLEITRDK